MADAEITLISLSETKTTDEEGRAAFTLGFGTYEYLVQKTGYLTFKGVLEMGYVATNVEVSLLAAEKVGFTITGELGQPLENTRISVTQGELHEILTTGADGKAEIYLLMGEYSYTIEKDIYALSQELLLLRGWRRKMQLR